MNILLWIPGAAAVLWVLAYARAAVLPWLVGIAAYLGAFTLWSGANAGSKILLWTVFLVLAAMLALPPLRRALISDPLLGWFRKALPQVSQTEQEALDAGTVWWDGELFSGNPDWNKLFGTPKPRLTPDEQAFLDGPVEELCRMCDDWRISHELNDLPPEVWQFIKDKGFLGMIIPRQYGGLGFSAYAHSQVIQKLATRSSTACVSVMVPNSLGPAELLLHYGTEAQKNHYLPRLARGLEMPCFALTGPDAGSDAGSIPDYGVVCKGLHEGREVLGIRLTWEKRYITLGPVATLLGLAFKLHDPEHLLGGREDIGITLALIPTQHPGVHIGRRHLPLNASFMNGPNWGRDVFIPLEWVIGGREYAGQGWRMLMECLAAGRSISLPSSSAGAAKLAARTTGAYSRVRSQFKIAIGKFEGIEEALARIGGNTYAIDAARTMTAGAVDLGEKPSVISAIVKYHCTERARQVINDAMDVHGGKGICLGPNNYLGRAYQQIPIGITVEGANILTRSMMIFGQGAIRCHPYVLREIDATRAGDAAEAGEKFDAAFWDHVRFVMGNAARSLWLGLTGAALVSVPGAPELRRYTKQFTRLAAGFALASDLAMLFLGGDLKRKEKLSARLGDILSQLYIASTVLKRFEDDGRPQADLPIAEWVLEDCLHRCQEAFYGVFGNFPSRICAWTLRLLVFPWGRAYAPPSDRLGQKVARAMIEPSQTRDRLTHDMFLHKHEDDPVGRLELAMQAAPAGEAVEAKVRNAQRAGVVSGLTDEARVAAALDKGVLTAEEAAQWRRFVTLRRACIMVDDFPHEVGRMQAIAGMPAEPRALTQRSAA
ncbi:MAG TPA: acyl-CoA dehydrogenase [Burkholderiales bacterium]|jgi:acyl-CoA dehydrogenase|nr:acyl-CoA dehydrogenase [Burkholderiales bacterium]